MSNALLYIEPVAKRSILTMSEPKTSDPLHSSCIRSARLAFGSAIFAGSPKQYTVNPPMGGKKTLISDERVISSGYEPPVSSKSDLRKTPSSARSTFQQGSITVGSLYWLAHTYAEPLSDARQIPHWLYRHLRNRELSRVIQADLSVWFQSP